MPISAKAQKEYRDKKVEKGLCLYCLEEHEPDVLVCNKHRIKTKQRKKRYYEKKGEQIRAKNQKRRDKAKTEGRCTRCLREKVDEGTCLCNLKKIPNRLKYAAILH